MSKIKASKRKRGRQLRSTGIVRRRLTTKRYSAEDMARYCRYLTAMNRIESLNSLRQWQDGPNGDRGYTVWV